MLVLLGAVPIVAMMQDGAGIFTSRPYAPVLWTGLTFLAAIALAEASAAPFPWSRDNGTPLLLAFPLIQAGIFLSSQRIFQRCYGRGSVNFSAAKNQRDGSGRVRWNDLIYWILIGYLGTALSFLVAFKSGLRLVAS
jgi:hypothetical protein